MDRGELADETVLDAVCMRLSAAIESVAAVDAEIRVRAFGAVWPAIWSVRNRIAHGYIDVDRTIIVATVENDLDGFEQALDLIDRDLPGSAPDESS
jgi:uncharacterized protein with HEPN domain